MIKFYIGLVLLLCILGCCRNDKLLIQKLDVAETLMDEQPDSALTLLQGIGSEKLMAEEHHARYALLYSQALDKNYIDEINDSLISIAVDYYKDRDEVRRKFLSYYYLGRIYTNADEPHKAMTAYMKAEQLVKELNDGYPVGLLYKEMANIYRSFYDFPKALDAYQQSIQCFSQAGKPVHKIQTMFSLSIIYRNMNDNKSAYSTLETALSESRNLDHSSLVKSCLGNLIAVCIDRERWEEATRWYQEYIRSYNDTDMTPQFNAYIARLHAKNGCLQEAREQMDRAWSKSHNLQDTVNLHYAESRLHLINQSWKQAYQSMEQGVSCQNRIVRESLQQPVLTAQKEFLDKELELNTYRLRMEKTLRAVSISTVSVIAFLIVFLVWRRVRKHYLEKLERERLENGLYIEQIQKEAAEREQGLRSMTRMLETELKEKDSLSTQQIERLKTELASTRQHIEESRKIRKEQSDYIVEQNRQRQKLESLLESRTASVRTLEDEKKALLIQDNLKEKLLKRYFTLMEDMISMDRREFRSEKDRLTQLAKFHHEYVENFFGNKQTDAKIERIVNECNGNVMKHFRKEIELPNETFFQLSCYLLVGYSVNFIASAMGVSKNVIYKRREQIREIINNSDSLNKDLFLQI